jgi:unsaturated rhamnogalacturonyl hydrolase
MYVFAITRAINAGWLSSAVYGLVVLRGWDGVTTKVNSSGQGTCIGTGLGWDDTFCLTRQTDVNAAHGYGPIFLVGVEIIELVRRYPNIGPLI